MNREQLVKGTMARPKIQIVIRGVAGPLEGKELTITTGITYRDKPNTLKRIQVSRYQLLDDWKPYFKKNAVSVEVDLIDDPAHPVTLYPLVKEIRGYITPKDAYKGHFTITASKIVE